MNTKTDEVVGRRARVLDRMREKLNSIEFLLAICGGGRQEDDLKMEVAELIGLVDWEKRDHIELGEGDEPLPF